MKQSFKLQRLILLLIIPILSGQIIFQGWLVYSQKKASVISGIDTTLLTVSDILGAFLYGDGHEELLTPKAVRSLAPYSVDYAIAIDELSGDLMRVNLKTGEGTRIPFADLPPIRSIAATQQNQVFYGLAEDQHTLYQINLSDNEKPSTQLLGNIPQPAQGIFFHSLQQRLCGFSETVFSIGLGNRSIAQTLETQPLFELEDIQAKSISYSAAKAQYLILDKNSTQLHIVETSGRRLEPLEITFADDAAAPSIHALLNHPNDQIVYAAGSTLGTLDLTSGAYTTEGMPQHYYSTEGPFYQNVRSPMVRIKEQLELTYLYTQYVTSSREIIYGVDATDTESENFTPPGFAEKISEEEFSKFQKLISHGHTIMTDIEYWENWGYLKSSHTPIFNQESKIIAMTGTDLSANSVYIETRKSTYSSILIGIGCLFIAALVSYLISLRLTKPIAGMKENALMLAAGSFAHRIETRGARELSALSQRMNTLANTLESQSTNTQLIHDRLSAHSEKQYLHRLFCEHARPTPSEPNQAFQITYQADHGTSEILSGHTIKQKNIIVWCFRENQKIPQDAHANLQIGILTEKLLEDPAVNWAQIKAQMLVFEDDLKDLNFFMIDANKNQLHSYLTHGVSLSIDSPRSPIQPIQANAAVTVPVDSRKLSFVRNQTTTKSNQTILEISLSKAPSDG